MIATCVEQKEILITKLMNLTKRMEVRSRQEIIDMGDFIEQRQDCMDRIDKCNALIDRKVEETENPAQKRHLTALTQAKCAPAACADEEERTVLEALLRCRQMLERASRLDSTVVKLIRAQRDAAMEKLNELRTQEAKSEEMFRFNG